MQRSVCWWSLGIVLALVIGCTPPEKPLDPAEVAAVVNGEVIPQAEIELQLDRLINKFREASPKLQFSDDKRTQMMENFLERAIKDRILLQESTKRGFDVEEAEIDTRIDQLKKMFGGTPEGDERFLAGISDMEEFRRKIGEQVRISKLMESVATEKAEVNDEMISNYYQENLERFLEKEQIKARHILIRWSDSPVERAEGAPSPEQKEAAMALIRQAAARLEAGEEFALVAQEMSQDPTSAIKGGELGSFARGSMVEPFETALLALEPGQTSEVVETQFGYHIIRLDQRIEERTTPLEEARERIVRSLSQESIRAQQDRFVEELKARAEIQIVE